MPVAPSRSVVRPDATQVDRCSYVDLYDVSLCENVFLLDRLAVEGAVAPDMGELKPSEQVLMDRRCELTQRGVAV